MTETAG